MASTTSAAPFTWMVWGSRVSRTLSEVTPPPSRKSRARVISRVRNTGRVRVVRSALEVVHWEKVTSSPA